MLDEGLENGDDIASLTDRFGAQVDAFVVEHPELGQCCCQRFGHDDVTPSQRALDDARDEGPDPL